MTFIKKNCESILNRYYMMRFGNLLKKDDYSTGLTIFPGIDMSLSLPKGCYFKNDGVVENIEEHVNYLDTYFMSKSNSDIDYSKATGTCYYVNRSDGSMKVSVIFIKDMGTYTNKLNYGHESMHAIRHFGIENQFIEKLEREGLSLKPFSEYKDEQEIAKLGFIVADYNLNKRMFPNNPTLVPLYNALLKEPEALKDCDMSGFGIINLK
jgi:hypothetical protein